MSASSAAATWTTTGAISMTITPLSTLRPNSEVSTSLSDRLCFSVPSGFEIVGTYPGLSASLLVLDQSNELVALGGSGVAVPLPAGGYCVLQSFGGLVVANGTTSSNYSATFTVRRVP
jgi:hypothetical protein